MKGRKDIRRSPGDPRLRVALILITGGLLLYASFNNGPRRAVKEARLAAEVKADEAVAREHFTKLTDWHGPGLAKAGPVVISSDQALRVADITAPGAYRCAIGLSVNNNAGQDISALEFGVRYVGPDGEGSTVHSLIIGGMDTQQITPVSATPGGCKGLSGEVTVYRCAHVDGTDCSNAVVILGDGPVRLSRKT